MSEEVTMSDVRREIVNYVKSGEFKSVIETQYRDLLKPNVVGCSISYDMSGTQLGKPQWVWGYTGYDNGGFHNGSTPQIVVPKGFGGMYLILAEASVTPVPSNPATSLDIDIIITTNNIVTSGGSPGTRSFGSSSAGPLDWTSNNFLELDEGDSLQIAGGSTSLLETWTCPVFSNHLSVIRFPFGS